MTLESEMHWRKYKDIVARANVVCLEVVVEITCRTRLEEPVGIVDEVPFRIENITQESTDVEDVPNLTCANLLRIMIWPSLAIISTVVPSRRRMR